MSRILIVEDSPTQAERLRLVLEDDGFQAEVASDAEAALALLAKTQFDLVVSDIVMPRMSGYDLCKEIKSNPRWKDTPIILLTTRREPMDIFRGLESGADNFYTKPYDPQRLIERIRTILHNRMLRSGGKFKMGIEIEFFGKTFVVGSEKEQILDLLISTFEDIVQANLDLEKNRNELAAAKQKIEEYARLLEGKVQSSEEKHRAIVESISEGIVTANEDGTITSVNPAAERIFGYGADDIVGKSINLLLSPPANSSAAWSPSDDLNGERETEGKRRDGSVFPLHLSTTGMELSGQRTFANVIRDLTSQKAAEQRFRQSQKMEAIGQLAGGIAHDFNNLLTVIIGNLELAELDNYVGEKIPTLIQTAFKAAESGAKLTHRLLAFSRQQVLQQEICGIGELILGMNEILRRTLGENIEIDISIPDDLPPTRIDTGEFENALLNLAINSRDAMPKGGKLAIEAERKYLDSHYAVYQGEVSPGDYVMVSVSDTGSGISKSVLDRVFEPFFTTKEKGKGTGLGLSMVHGFIKQSGGHLSVYSEPGLGTTFRIYLPVAQEAEKPLTERETMAVPSSGGVVTVLIVDDNPDVRQIGISMLETLGYRVLAADSAAQALVLLEQHDDIDVLFTDVVMSGEMNGAELAAEAGKRWPHLRMAFCSGFTDRAVVNVRGLGRDAVFIDKPYRASELAQKIKQVLS